MKSFFASALCVFSCLAFAAAGHGATVTAEPPTSVFATSAVLKATVNAQGVDQELRFQTAPGSSGGTFTDRTPTSPATATGTTDTAVTYSLTGLTASTTYRYKITARPTGGSATDDVSSTEVVFTTPAGGASITLTAASNLLSTSVTLNGSVTLTAGYGNATDIKFSLGEATGNYSKVVNATPSATTAVTPPATATSSTPATSIQASFTGLTANKKYFYKVTAVDSQGATISSAESNFTTKNADGSGGDPGGGTGSQGGGTGVLVYDINFKHLAGFGIDFFEDGYVIVPATGGDGEVIFMGREHGQRIYSKQSGVKFFFAKSRTERYSVITMSGSSGATVSMQAYGKADDKLKAEGEDYTITVRASRTLHGLAQAARDETAATTTDTDGSTGFVEFAEMKLSLNSRETDRANRDAMTVANKATELETAVSRRGYSKLSAGTTTTDPNADADADAQQ